MAISTDVAQQRFNEIVLQHNFATHMASIVSSKNAPLKLKNQWRSLVRSASRCGIEMATQFERLSGAEPKRARVRQIKQELQILINTHSPSTVDQIVLELAKAA